MTAKDTQAIVDHYARRLGLLPYEEFLRLRRTDPAAVGIASHIPAERALGYTTQTLLSALVYMAEGRTAYLCCRQGEVRNLIHQLRRLAAHVGVDPGLAKPVGRTEARTGPNLQFPPRGILPESYFYDPS